MDVYRKYITNMGWKATIIDESSGDDGGYKNVVLEVTGDKVYSKMKWEAGVHRVQRVPATESQGRVHTSTATVAIMPECDEVDVKIDPKDLTMSTMRSGGAGGQVRYVQCCLVLLMDVFVLSFAQGLPCSFFLFVIIHVSECQQSRNRGRLDPQTNRHPYQMHSGTIAIEK